MEKTLLKLMEEGNATMQMPISGKQCLIDDVNYTLSHLPLTAKSSKKRGETTLNWFWVYGNETNWWLWTISAKHHNDITIKHRLPHDLNNTNEVMEMREMNVNSPWLSRTNLNALVCPTTTLHLLLVFSIWDWIMAFFFGENNFLLFGNIYIELW